MAGRRVTGLAGIAHALADSLPAGAEVRVEWLQPTLGPGVDASAPSAQSEAVLEDRWLGPESSELRVAVSAPQGTALAASEVWLVGAGPGRQHTEPAR